MKSEVFGFVAIKEAFTRRNGDEGFYIKVPVHAKLPDGGFSEEAEIWITVFLPDAASDRVALPEKGDRVRVAGYFQPDAESPNAGIIRPMEIEILQEGDGGNRGNARSSGRGNGGRSSGSNRGNGGNGGSNRGGSRSGNGNGGSRGSGNGGSRSGGYNRGGNRAARGHNEDVPF